MYVQEYTIIIKQQFVHGILSDDVLYTHIDASLTIRGIGILEESNAVFTL